jgi:hypothetical protein
MISTTVKPAMSVTDMYMSVLGSLRINRRLDLIARLSESIKIDPEKPMPYEDLLTMFHGDWEEVPQRNEMYHSREIMNW